MEFSESVIKTFVAESKDLLTKMEEVLLKIDQGDQSLNLIDELFRAAHTFKGAAGMFGFTELSSFIHEIENLLASFREKKNLLNQNQTTIFLEIVDCLSNLLESSINKNIAPELIKRKQDLLNKLNSRDVETSNTQIKSPDTSKLSQESKINAINFIKTDPNKLDDIINIIGEIVVAQEYILNLIKKQPFDYLKLITSTENLSKLIENLKNLSLQLRMLPVKEIFSKFNRVVRDIASQKNKNIKLQIFGDDTALDKTIIDKINEPLLHLVRNACDHGIDLPEERVAAGKSECGVITLQACQENGEVIINTSDDGKGIDLELVKQKAIKLGLINQDLQVSEQEILSYIFEPGFSTSEQVTDISGRGFGMDIVKKEIEKLHGSINIKTKKTQGTTISIRLPLSLAIIDGLLIKIGDFLCIIPLWNVVECVEINPEAYKLMKNQNYFNWRNKIIPVIILNDLWNASNCVKQKNNTLIIVRYMEYQIGIMIDCLHGAVQTVIKPVPEILTNIDWINGTAILGGGEVAIILDIPGLVTNVTGKYKQLFGATI